MAGKIVDHSSYLTVDAEFIGLQDCFEAYRRAVTYREKDESTNTLVITNSPDVIEYQEGDGNVVLLTRDDIHNVLVFRVFFSDDRLIKPVYVYNQREYQIACEFVRRLLNGQLEPKEEWLA